MIEIEARSERRIEDRRFLTGQGRFCDDVSAAGLVHAVFVRSQVAHARLVSVDCADARTMPGVLAVYADEDVRLWNLGALPCVMRPEPRPGGRLALPPRWPLARERVRHVGEAVAMVVAQTLEQAMDAAERVAVELEDLPSVVDATRAGLPDQPQLHSQAPGNVAIEWEQGDAAEVERILAQAPHSVRLSVANNRLACCPLETRGAVGLFDRRERRLTLFTGSQGVHNLRGILAETIFKIPQRDLRVVTEDVGGSFGMKMYLYPEQVMVLAAARDLGRPVKWMATRQEGFQSDSQGRDLHSEAELALDGDGRFLALRVESQANLGAYLSSFGPFIPTAGGTRALAGPYRTPRLHVRVSGLFTNTAPVDAYRGAGRPEVAYLLERLVDCAARQLGIDRAELRRRNLITPEEMPFRTANGQTYDSGDFGRNLDGALEAIGWSDFAARRRTARARGTLAGIGVALYVEPCGGGRDQRCELRFAPDGSTTVLIGSQSTGMGHETAYAQIASAWLGTPLDKIRVVQGDSDLVSFGRGTSGSRSLPIGGNALLGALQRAVEKGRALAAFLMQSDPARVEFSAGCFRVAAADRTMSWAETIAASFEPARLPPGMEPGLDCRFDYVAVPSTYPNGCHACEVEIDEETGHVRIVRFVAVDDFGRVINPLLVEGQVHGGLAQGIGQALMEEVRYEPNGGQLVTGSFVDYALPRAADLPGFELRLNQVPCTTNPLGVKGCGEAGAMGAPPAVMNAVLDALAPAGVSHLQMPATAAKIWAALAAARKTRREEVS